MDVVYGPSYRTIREGREDEGEGTPTRRTSFGDICSLPTGITRIFRKNDKGPGQWEAVSSSTCYTAYVHARVSSLLRDESIFKLNNLGKRPTSNALKARGISRCVRARARARPFDPTSTTKKIK